MYNPKIPLILARKPFRVLLLYVFVVYKTDLHYRDTGEVYETCEKNKTENSLVHRMK